MFAVYGAPIKSGLGVKEGNTNNSVVLLYLEEACENENLNKIRKSYII